MRKRAKPEMSLPMLVMLRRACSTRVCWLRSSIVMFSRWLIILSRFDFISEFDMPGRGHEESAR